MINSKRVWHDTLTPEEKTTLRKAYDTAAAASETEFTWEEQQFFVPYMKYMYEFLEKRGAKNPE